MRSIARTLIALLATGLVVLGGAAADARPATTFQDASVLAFRIPDRPPLDDGHARLLRTRQGVTATAWATGVDPGAYTLWWVVWNAPQNCATPHQCVESDLADPDVEVDIGYGGGHIVGSSGRLRFAAHLRVGQELHRFPAEFGIPVTGTGLTDAAHAEVHLVVRSHGPSIPGLLGDMVRSFNGGCTYDGPLAGTAPAYGEAGPNGCVDQYFAVFPSLSTP